MELAKATVRRVWAESSRFTGVVLEVAPQLASSYERPGQYVVVHAEGAPVFLALASAPGEWAAFELLLAPPATELLRPREGDHWGIEAPQGSGFPIEAAEGEDVLLMGVGSGLGPLRATIESLRKTRTRYGRITLYAGAQEEEHHPYRSAEPGWRADGIEVYRTNSKPFVQDLLRVSSPPLGAVQAFICGHKEMVDDVSATLVALGLSADRIHQNY